MNTDLLAVRAYNLACISTGIAHDLNGRLNAMVVNLEMLKQVQSMDKETQRYTEAISSEIQQLNRQIATLISQIAPIDYHLAKLNLKDFIDEVLILIGAHARHRRVQLKVTVTDDNISVQGVEGELNQAVLTLILDMLEVMPSGGELYINLTKIVQNATLELCCKSADPLDTSQISLESVMSQSTEVTRMHIARTIIQKQQGSIEMRLLADNQLCARITLPLAL